MLMLGPEMKGIGLHGEGLVSKPYKFALTAAKVDASVNSTV